MREVGGRIVRMRGQCVTIRRCDFPSCRGSASLRCSVRLVKHTIAGWRLPRAPSRFICTTSSRSSRSAIGRLSGRSLPVGVSDPYCIGCRSPGSIPGIRPSVFHGRTWRFRP